MSFFLLPLAFALALLFLALSRKSDPARAAGLEGAWADAMASENSTIGRVLMSVSRPIGGLPYVHLPEESAQYKAIRNKLNAARGAYGGHVEIFLSVQIMCAFLAALGAVVLVLTGAGGPPLFAGAIICVIGGVMPWYQVDKAAKERADAVTRGLPEFAEMLLMPLSSGYGVMPALDFTAARLAGPVAEEVRLMLTVLDSRARTEQQAFVECAERLGTPEAMSFFTALMQAYLDGVKVVDNLRGQAAGLRQQAHQRSRAEIKTLPNKLVFIIALHLLPVFFVVTLLPTFISLGSM